MKLQENLKRSFIGGLILLGPFILTIVIIKLFLNSTSGLTEIVVQLTGLGKYTGQSTLIGQLIVLFSSAVFVTLTGLVARSKTGKTILGGFGRLVNIVPMYRTLYFSLKHLANSLVENKSHYENTVVVEYPHEGIYRVGFTTSKTQSEIQSLEESNLLNVFLPNSPNPTAGIMVILPEERIHEVDMTVREGFKLVMTTGISNKKVEKMIEH